MLVWLKDLQSNWLSWLAVALTLVVSSASCTLALAMLVASSGAEENPAGPVGGTVLGMALGGWMSGAIYDLTGSYQAAFLNGIAWNLVNMTIAVWLLLHRWRPTPSLAA